MTRDELIEELSDLRDYHTVSKRTCDYLKLDLLRDDYHYNAGNDFRIADLFDYLSPTEASFPQYIDYAAFTIVANVARFSMYVPTEEQMIQMLKISGYSGGEMKNYVRSDMELKASCVSATQLVPTVCLLSRVLADAMMDKSEWQGYKKGKKKKNFTPAPNPSMQKLQNLVKYMDDQNLLNLDLMEDEECREFICNHSRYICRLACIQKELRSVSDAIERQMREIEKEIIRETEHLKKKKSKGSSRNAFLSKEGAAKPAPVAPLSSIPSLQSPLPSPEEFSALFQTSAGLSSWNRDKNVGDYSGIPPEIKALLKRMEQFEDEAGTLEEECWGISDQLEEENSDERAGFVSDEFIPGVATAFFQAILDGDEIYKLKVGRIVLEDMMSMSDMPLPGSFSTELDDDADWDDIFTECNGKLALPVLKEGECLTYPLDKETESFRYTIPITAMIARYADRPFEAPLYIRKSLIQKFKEFGCSDRKARDYAVIIATLSKVNHLEDKDYSFAAEYPEPEEKQTKVTLEEKVDARIQEEIEARKEAERALQQAQKENQVCRHEISTLQREIEKLKNQLAVQEHAEDDGIAALSKKSESDAGSQAEYPYRTKLRVVLYGGFDVFHRELLKLLPDVRVVETAAHIDINPIRNADIVFLQINKTDHSGYWTVCDACKNSGVPYIHLNYASARRCAGVMVEEIRKIEGEKGNG